MCFGAIYWARPDKLFIACSRDDAADAGFDDAFIYDEIEKPQHERQIAVQNILRDEAMQIFEDWKNKTERIEY
jgi:tRNA(Arg) A34 adenosine deaminase TadA